MPIPPRRLVDICLSKGLHRLSRGSMSKSAAGIILDDSVAVDSFTWLLSAWVYSFPSDRIVVSANYSLSLESRSGYRARPRWKMVSRAGVAPAVFLVCRFYRPVQLI